MKRIILSLLLFIPYFSYAQNELDVLRYSENFIGGTARSMSMANAFGALGADASVLSNNPAGLGVYRVSEYTITPVFSYTDTKAGSMPESSFSSPGFSDHRLSFGLGNHAIVLSFANKSDKLWERLNFSFGYNELNSFQSNEVIKGVNNENSLLNFFMYNSDGNWPENLGVVEGMSFDTYLTDTIPYDPDLLYSNFLYGVSGLDVKKIVERRGKIGEYAISMAANFGNNIYFGGTIGIHNLRYDIRNKYSEFDALDQSELSEFTYDEHFTIRGVGANLKLGVIARINDYVRIGAALHTPTFYSITDEMDLQMDSYFDVEPYPESGTIFSATSGLDLISYEITTPLKAQANLAIILKKYGAINVDYEYVDYTTATIRASEIDFTDLDPIINDNLQAASNLKVGGELLLGYLALRAGAAYYQSPYSNLAERVVEGDKLFYTAGLGFRYSKTFFDIAYVYSKYQEQEFLYPVLENEAIVGARKDVILNRLAFTLGFKF